MYLNYIVVQGTLVICYSLPHQLHVGSSARELCFNIKDYLKEDDLASSLNIVIYLLFLFNVRTCDYIKCIELSKYKLKLKLLQYRIAA